MTHILILEDLTYIMEGQLPPKKRSVGFQIYVWIYFCCPLLKVCPFDRQATMPCKRNFNRRPQLTNSVQGRTAMHILGLATATKSLAVLP